MDRKPDERAQAKGSSNIYELESSDDESVDLTGKRKAEPSDNGAEPTSSRTKQRSRKETAPDLPPVRLGNGDLRDEPAANKNEQDAESLPSNTEILRRLQNNFHSLASTAAATTSISTTSNPATNSDDSNRLGDMWVHLLRGITHNSADFLRREGSWYGKQPALLFEHHLSTSTDPLRQRCHAALQFLNSHIDGLYRDTLKGCLFGPLCMYLRVDGAGVATALHHAVPEDILLQYVVDSEADADALNAVFAARGIDVRVEYCNMNTESLLATSINRLPQDSMMRLVKAKPVFLRILRTLVPSLERMRYLEGLAIEQLEPSATSSVMYVSTPDSVNVYCITKHTDNASSRLLLIEPPGKFAFCISLLRGATMS